MGFVGSIQVSFIVSDRRYDSGIISRRSRTPLFCDLSDFLGQGGKNTRFAAIVEIFAHSERSTKGALSEVSSRSRSSLSGNHLV